MSRPGTAPGTRGCSSGLFTASTAWCRAAARVKRLVVHTLVPGAVPGLDIGLDPGEEVGACPLFRGQSLGAEPAYLAIEGVDVYRLRPVVLDHDPAADDDCRDIGAHRTLDKGLGDVEIRVDPGIARHPVEIDEDRVALHAGK